MKNLWKKINPWEKLCNRTQYKLISIVNWLSASAMGCVGLGFLVLACVLLVDFPRGDYDKDSLNGVAAILNLFFVAYWLLRAARLFFKRGWKYFRKWHDERYFAEDPRLDYRRKRA